MNLSTYRVQYFTSRHDLSESTLALHRTTWDYLEQNLGRGANLQSVTRAQAQDFATFMAGQKMQLSTQRAHLTRAKQIFQRAADIDLVGANPFDRVKTTLPQVDTQWRYVSVQEAEQMIELADDWRLPIALARFAGLRANEIKRLQWADVDLAQGAISVTNPGRVNTTKKRARTVPIQPSLSAELSLALSRLGNMLGDPLPAGAVCNVGWGNYLRQIERVRKLAGVTEYGKPMHTLRKSLETDWLQAHPLPAVCEWLGHDPAVAMKHYFKVTKETFAAVTEKE